jgi:hypothetical protein
MNGTCKNTTQLSLLNPTLEELTERHIDSVNCPLSRQSVPSEGISALQRRHGRALRTIGHAAPPHQASRGDLFRELAEQDQAGATRQNPNTPTPQLARCNIYRRWSHNWSFEGRKKPKGPVDRLRRTVGGNRYAEFDARLTKLPGVKGASLPVRYVSLLAYIAKEIEEIGTDFQYTDAWYSTGPNDPTQEARERLARARGDVGELAFLFQVMAALYSHLHYTKRYIACPPPPPSPQEEEALLAQAAQRERNARLEEARQNLRYLTFRSKYSDDSIRRGFGWITLENMICMLTDDLTGYGCPKVQPLWPSVPSVEQLAMDYQIGKSAAARVLAAYAAHRTDSPIAQQTEPVGS